MVAARRLWLVAILLLWGACTRDNPFEQGLEPTFRRSDAPSGLSLAVIAYNRIDLSWQDNSSTPDETGFQVHRANGPGGPFALFASLPAGSTSYGNFDLTGATSYCYEVRAFRTTGKNTTYSEFSNVACATTLPPPIPAAPSNTNAVPAFSTQITVTWADNSNNEVGFRVEFSLDAGTTWQGFGGDLSANLTTLSHWGRTPEQSVCYRVSAFNSFGSSAPSNSDCTAPPLAPGQLVGVGVAGPAIDLSWSDNSSVEDGYEVRRAAPNAPSVVVADLPANTQSYHDAAAAPNIRFTYSVAALKDGGFSDFASVSAMSASTPPPAPDAIDAYPLSSSVMQVNWSAQTDNVEDFRVERSIDGGASWSTVLTVPWHQQSIGDAVPSEQGICYRVVALNSVGESASGLDCTAAPAGPTDLSATPVDGAAIDLSWTDNSNLEDGFEVRQVLVDCGYWSYYCYTYYVTVANLPPNTTSFRYAGLDPASFYSFVVVARKDGGDSDLSNEAGSYPGPAGP